MDKFQLEKLLGLCEYWVGLCLTGRIRMASRGETISDHGAQSQEMFSKCRGQDEGCMEKKNKLGSGVHWGESSNTRHNCLAP